MAGIEEAIRLKDVKLRTDGYDNRLDVTYYYEDSRHIKEIHLNGVAIPIKRDGFTFINHVSSLNEVDIGFGYTPVLDITETVIKEKTVEVTMEEIEKKFGCKVKIVKEK